MRRRLLSVLAAVAGVLSGVGSLYLALDVPTSPDHRAYHATTSLVTGVVSRPLPGLSEQGRFPESARSGLGLNYLLGRYSTYFNPELTGRIHNIRLAARQVDGLLLQPGQVFSFNEVVGPRTREAGFLPAPELVGGELVDGVGGGICQLSSTLYNAVLYAFLTVTERVHHSRPLGYVPAGRDATVYNDILDFRFVNSSTSPILITAEVVENRLTVGLWGSQPAEHQVQIERSAERRLPAPVEFIDDPRLPAGTWKLVQQGWDGVEVTVFRYIYTPAGELLRREQLHRDYYAPRAYIVRKGRGLEAKALIKSLHVTSDAKMLLAAPGAAGLP